jgi:TRAP-type C4-dicarboxylate transport system substrate-binding protein
MNRHVGICGLVVSFMLVVGAGAPAQAVDWRVTGNMPPQFFSSVIMSDLINKVKASTTNGLRLTFFPGETMMPSRDVPTAISRGTVEMALGDFNYEALLVPLAAGPTLPLLLSTEQWQKAMAPGQQVRKLLEAAFEEKGLRILGIWTQGAAGMATKKPLVTADEWKGKKIRVNGNLLASFVRRTGAEVVSMTGEEAVDALRRGILDAGQVPLPATFSRGYGEFIKYWIRWNLSETLVPIYVNRKAFDSLSPEYQKALVTAATEAERRGWPALAAEEAKAAEGLTKLGVQVVNPAPAEMAKMMAFADATNNEWAAKVGPTAQQLLSLVKQARGQ